MKSDLDTVVSVLCTTADSHFCWHHVSLKAQYADTSRQPESCFTVLESLAQRLNVDGAALLPFGCKIEEVLTTKGTNNHTFKASTDYQKNQIE